MGRKRADLAEISEDNTVEFKEKTFNYECQLDVLPTVLIEATSEQAAIDAYYKMFGIISSEKMVNVKRLTAI